MEIKTYYYIYKITCTAGSFKDHYYIGQHKTQDLDDGYKGSGVKIQKYYQKYPNDYKKEILCWCDSEEDMNLKEDFYVGDLYKTDPMCLNLRAGGMQSGFSEETRKKMSEFKRRTGKNHHMYGKHPSEETRRKMSETRKGKHLSEETRKKLSEYNKGENHPNYGKHLSEETRKKMSKSHKGKHLSEETMKKICKPIAQYDLEGNLIKIYKSMKEAALQGFSIGEICKCCKGNCKTHKGYIWKYERV